MSAYTLECAPEYCGQLRRRYEDGSIHCDKCGRVLYGSYVSDGDGKPNNIGVAVVLGIGWLTLFAFHRDFALGLGGLVLAIVALIYSPWMLFYLVKGIWMGVTFLYNKCRRSSLPRRTVVPIAASRPTAPKHTNSRHVLARELSLF